ncbi:cupin domain-containing protein [Lentzea sp. DG1S-22]|uniref:cupin domain-containing protein n=1 Tax=Lentzea sp. DG1S-22 TaxID=3108822 RepID=UPI002E76BA01|nr:cupin domain-containing protein [Lentzea sp. DG1S-22]WVH84201.1 cupin domain-containing protein [Lentzea sp. DG1S-22]
MSYPEEVYSGDSGEVSAQYRPVTTAPELGREGDGIHYLATTESTRGEFGLYRVMMRPKAPGPSTHFHRTISESFFILDGVVSLFDGERWTEAGKGDFLHVPQGGLHAFHNASDEPAEMLLLFTPGAPREEYFEKLGEVAKEDLTAFRVKHDSYFV